MDYAESPEDVALREQYRARVALISERLVSTFVPKMKAVRRVELRVMQRLAELMLPYEDEQAKIEEDLAAANPPPPQGTREYVSWVCEMSEKAQAVFEARHPEIRGQVEELHAKSVEELEAAGDLSDIMDEFISAGGTEEEWHDLDQAILLRVFSQSAPIAVQRALDHPGGIMTLDVLPALGLDFAQAAARLTIDPARFRDFLDAKVDLTEDEAKEVENAFVDPQDQQCRFRAELIINMQKARAQHKAANPQFY